MKVGDVVTIYEDPITQKKPEGQAKLLRRHFDLSLHMKYWTVQFLSTGEIVERWIKEAKP